MLTQAVSLAVLAAISPTALLVAAVFLGAASPRRTVVIYLAGAIVMTAVMATVVFVVLRAGHLYKPHQREPRYGVRLGLGVLMLAVGLYLRRRGPRRKDPAKKKGEGLISRMISHPGPKEAFIVGILVYSPSLTFIGAVQAVATSKENITASVFALALVIAITLLCVWVPLLLYLFMPERTGRLLASFNGWLRTHGRALGLGALLVGGVLLLVNGILGLAGVV
jgi:Sap, sulfolipid-1-addressing protein